MKSFGRLLIRHLVLKLPFLILILLWNCKPTEPYVYVCEDGFMDYETGESIRHFQSIINPKDSLVTLVIKTDADYKKYIVDTPQKVNFSNQTLLVGRIHTPMPGSVVKQSIKSHCISNEIYFDVQYKVNIDGTANESEVPFYAVIPRISEETRVRFIIHR
ncbi:hypothetical protein [Dyadobacter sp. 3J3]|uniref:hypothetical protein n=1 Tax=Dyadobacter sp. 3J3 TaxID=2606600 RepID=UPI001356BF68|nr:hypothetical protein [Dyadobacter sp. 3J3]